MVISLNPNNINVNYMGSYINSKIKNNLQLVSGQCLNLTRGLNRAETLRGKKSHRKIRHLFFVCALLHSGNNPPFPVHVTDTC